jgi:hypothetical protein
LCYLAEHPSEEMVEAGLDAMLNESAHSFEEQVKKIIPSALKAAVEEK